MSGEGWPDRAIQEVHLPADRDRSDLDQPWMRSFSTARVSDLSVQAANDISVFPSNLAALRAILKQFYISQSVGSGWKSSMGGRGIFRRGWCGAIEKEKAGEDDKGERR